MSRLIDVFHNDYNYTDFHELNLSWVIAKVKELLDRMKSIETWKEGWQDTIDNLQQFYDNLVAGNYPPEFVDNLKIWIEKYGVEIIANAIKMVFFTITDDGYYSIIIPDNWEEIIFGVSGYDDYPDGISFGHLTLSY